MRPPPLKIDVDYCLRSKLWALSVTFMSLGKKQRKANVTTATLSVLAQVFGIYYYIAVIIAKETQKQPFFSAN